MTYWACVFLLGSFLRQSYVKLLLELCKVVEFQNKTNPGDLKTILDYVAVRDFWYCSSPSYLQLSPKCLQLKHSIVKDKTIDLEMQTAQ